MCTSSSTTTTTDAAGTSWTDKFQTNEQQHPYHQKVKRIVYRGRMAIHPHPTIMDIMDYAETEPSYDWDNFQKYIAVLDIDTLHYPQLLCQNSVILKVSYYEPRFGKFSHISRCLTLLPYLFATMAFLDDTQVHGYVCGIYTALDTLHSSGARFVGPRGTIQIHFGA